MLLKGRVMPVNVLGEAVRSEGKKRQKLRSTGKIGKTTISGCFIEERKSEFSHGGGGGGGLCTYIEKLDAEFSIRVLLAVMVHQLRAGK